MMSKRTKRLGIGIFLLTTFSAVMVAIFLPLFADENALDYLDNLYNSISKGSAYYIPKTMNQVEEHGSEQVTLNLKFADMALAEEAAPLLEGAGASTAIEGGTLTTTGDLGAILSSCLADAESAYHNRDDDLVSRYGVGARSALHAWWQTLGAMEKDLNRQKLFDAARLTHTVQSKTVECAYNYYGIEAQAIKDRWVTVMLSLVFYVLYTIWYGYGIMYLFEGMGLELSAH